MVVTVETHLHDLAGGVLRDEIAGAALGDDPPLVHDDQSIAELLGLIHVMGGEDQGHALALEPEEPIPQDVPRLRVQPGGRLIEQQQLGVVDQAAGNDEATLHPSGEGLDLVAAPLGELRELQQLIGASAHLGAGEAKEAAVNPEVLLDR